MKALILAIVLGIMTISAPAVVVASEASQSSLLCPMVYANALKKKLPPQSTDKYKHCTLSCQLALRCSAMDTLGLGILKELWDLISPGNAEWEDLRADAIGIDFAITKQARTDKECNYQCKNIYWE